MGILEVFLIGVGLSMDAFAVSVCRGLKMQKLSVSQTVLIAVFFGGFQALMPLVGWFWEHSLNLISRRWITG